MTWSRIAAHPSPRFCAGTTDTNSPGKVSGA